MTLDLDALAALAVDMVPEHYIHNRIAAWEALPALIAEVRSLRAEVERLRAALRTIATDDPDTRWNGWREVRRLRDIAADAVDGDAT